MRSKAEAFIFIQSARRLKIESQSCQWPAENMLIRQEQHRNTDGPSNFAEINALISRIANFTFI